MFDDRIVRPMTSTILPLLQGSSWRKFAALRRGQDLQNHPKVSVARKTGSAGGELDSEQELEEMLVLKAEEDWP